MKVGLYSNNVNVTCLFVILLTKKITFRFPKRNTKILGIKLKRSLCSTNMKVGLYSNNVKITCLFVFYAQFSVCLTCFKIAHVETRACLPKRKLAKATAKKGLKIKNRYDANQNIWE